MPSEELLIREKRTRKDITTTQSNRSNSSDLLEFEKGSSGW